jgi:hypothetical protein
MWHTEAGILNADVYKHCKVSPKVKTILRQMVASLLLTATSERAIMAVSGEILNPPPLVFVLTTAEHYPSVE